MSSISLAFQGPDDHNLVIKFLVIELEVNHRIENDGSKQKAENDGVSDGSNDSRESWKSPAQI